jgi:hypothetical protein
MVKQTIRCGVIVCLLFLSHATLIQAFSPPPAEVCKDGKLDSRLFVAWALDQAKVPRKVIFQGGDQTGGFSQERDAVVNREFCKTCSAADAATQHTVVDNAIFYFAPLPNGANVPDTYSIPANAPVFTLTRKSGVPINPTLSKAAYPLNEILEDQSPWTVTCTKPEPTFSETAEKTIKTVTSPFVLRASPQDLWVPKDGSSDKQKQQFSALKSATVGFTVDNIANKESFNIDGVLGVPLAQFFQHDAGTGGVQGGSASASGFDVLFDGMVPYLEYDRQYVKTSSPLKINDVNNLKPGLLFRYGYGWSTEGSAPTHNGPLEQHYTFAVDFWGNPAFVYSAKSGAEVTNFEFGLRPEPYIPIPHLDYLLQNYTDLGFDWLPVAMKAYGEGHGLFGNVIDKGNDQAVASTGNFERLGPEEGITFVSKEGFFQNVNLTVFRRDLYALKGEFEHLSRTEVSFNYGLPTLKNMTLSLTYFNGRDENTYEDQDQVALTLGLKF